MKFKHCFALTVILIILFSLGTVAASENTTDDASSVVSLVSDIQIPVDETDGLCKSQDIDDNPSLSEDGIDLYVFVDVKDVYSGNKYNQPGFEVPWTITAIVDGGTAHNVKVNVKLSDNIKYLSTINSTKGTFNSKTGVWSIGDLSSSSNATLSILTELLDGEKFTTTADATTDSNDIDLSNNEDFRFIKSGTGKFDSNTTNTKDDKNDPQRNQYRPNDPENNGWKDIEGEGEKPTEQKTKETPINEYDPQPTGPQDQKEKDRGSDSDSGGDGGSNSQSKSITENNGGVLAKTAESFSSAISNTLGTLTNLFGSNSTANDDGSRINLSTETVKAISAQNYIKIPILIFALFLILLVGIVAYGKFKP